MLIYQLYIFFKAKNTVEDDNMTVEQFLENQFQIILSVREYFLNSNYKV